MAAVASFDTEALAQLLADNSGVINVMQYSNGNRLKQLKWIPGTDYLILIFYHYDYSEQKPALCRVISLRSKEVVRTIELRPDTNSYVMEVRDNLLYFGNGSHLELYDIHSLSLVHTFIYDSAVTCVNFVEDSSEAFVALSQAVHLIDVEYFTTTEKYGRPADGGFHYVHPQTQLALSALYHSSGEMTFHIPYDLASGRELEWVCVGEKHEYGNLGYIRPLDQFGFTYDYGTPNQIFFFDTRTFQRVSQAATPVDFQSFLYLSGTNFLIAESADTLLDVTDWSVYTILSEVSDPDNPGVKVKFTLFDWNEALRCIVSGSPSGLVRFSVI
mmetsp:Transcript_34572/g.60707  ORF Transcript_34572/g.60707 Transcript_34572/m.60707 type:complete len:329 (-) Transcript_34572:240-1226(-)|eukprot:CAMPEP_0204915744 /NCGR_PEP_ID=MMETSP1397-20131031/13694_1 /ASSEMBLY_ACC=CAM_ASM_000891 /TAXON_ID=49980 /ORGANISM="Climacostomum Climacostomum virens, Strain Stock W-24" /LENGTH=328 /DNA_ID=CAMNT_0052087939 /DNA_START=51 /DNA_END=1037 /DNA_ORIENTATION=+